jgi:hypothetical protein
MKILQQSTLTQNEIFKILQCAETLTCDATVFIFDSIHPPHHGDNSIINYVHE